MSTSPDAFGLGGSLPGDVNMNPDDSPTDQGPPAPPPPIDPALEAATPEAEVQTPAPEQPTPGQEQQQLWAKKYQTPEALEKAYVELQGAYTRASQERAQFRGELDSFKQQLDEFAPILKQSLAAQDPELAQVFAQQDMIAPMVEQQVAPLREQYEQQATMQAESQEVASFYQRHPEIQPYSMEDQMVTSVMQELDMNVEHATLEIAYEAARNPALYEVLKGNPAFVDTDEGVALARRLAGGSGGGVQTPAPPTAAPVPVQAAPPPPQPVQPTSPQQAFSESASGSTSPGSEAKPGDIWEEAVAAFRKAQGNSVFGV